MGEKRVLPERTVDIWTATYITGRCWYARLWAPTEKGTNEGYDLAVGLREITATRRPGPVPRQRRMWPEKVFVLEHKGVVEGEKVPIDYKQLENHLAGDRQAGGRLVYYVLPALAPSGGQPDRVWTSKAKAPYGQIPPPADLRLRGPGIPGFQDWAVVVNVENLDRYLKAQGEPGAIEAANLWSIAGAQSLKRFLSATAECKQGRKASEMEAFIASQLADGGDDFDQQSTEGDGPPAVVGGPVATEGPALYRTFIGTV
jgi:hypothetical protein